VYFHLILTDDCNLCCSYCRAKVFEELEDNENETSRIEIDPDVPMEIAFELDLLYNFLKKDPSATLTFYGGEPLLRSDIIDKIVREAPVNRFMVQTNGLLLDKLEPEIINRFATILVSLDGREEVTDYARGEGVYRKVMDNIKKIKDDGYAGEIIARMTVTEHTDITDDVHWLAENPDHPFSSIHWQLDANFAGDFSKRRFAQWLSESYNPGVRNLVTDWVDHMENSGEVLRWYPFIDPMEDLLYGRASLLRCGSGHANYCIMTDGHITPCPVMIGMKKYYLGHIRDADPIRLPRISVDGDCNDCRIRSFCGGRCLYSNITKPWGTAERKLVCSSVENLYDALNDALPRVQGLIESQKINLPAFIHEKFNGCEIIP
jgi:uncharacterized protein